MFSFKFTNWMTNSVDPDQMASSEAIWSGSTLFAKVGVVVNSRIRVIRNKYAPILSQLFPFIAYHLFRRAVAFSKANRKSQIVSFLSRMTENLPRVSGSFYSLPYLSENLYLSLYYLLCVWTCWINVKQCRPSSVASNATSVLWLRLFCPNNQRQIQEDFWGDSI